MFEFIYGSRLAVLAFLFVPVFAWAGPADDFVTTWDTAQAGTSNGTSITIPTDPGSTYNYDIDVDNDGTFDVLGETGNYTHDFGVAGTYTIRIQGTFPRIFFNNGGDRQKILSVDQWGTGLWTDMSLAFFGCTNLTVPATDAPNLTNVTNMTSMFHGASSFNENINHWDVSNIENMTGTFFGATSFNQPLNSWVTTSLENMFLTFGGASDFDQPLNSWDVSNVTSMSGTFFQSTSFNQDLNNWELAAGVSPRSMFQEATNFNGDITNWNIIQASDLGFMFKDASSFNRDISGWNMSNITNLDETFRGATSFNRDISGWDVSNLATASMAFDNAGLSTVNYDNLLIGWEAQTVQNGVTIGALNLNFCNGATARTDLNVDHAWNFAGDSLDCTNANNAPTDVQIDGADVDTVSENQTIGATVGTLTSIDADGGDTHTYSLSCAAPGADDTFFQVNGIVIQTTGVLDFERPMDANNDNNYEICVQSDDGNFGTFDKNLTIRVRDITSNESSSDAITASIPVKSVPTQGRGRYAGQSRDEYDATQKYAGRVTKHNFDEAYEFSVAEIAKINDGRPAKIIEYVDSRGEVKFLGYVHGKLSVGAIKEGQTFQIVWRPFTSSQRALAAMKEANGEAFQASAGDSLEARWSDFYQKVFPSLKPFKYPPVANPDRGTQLRRTNDLETIVNRLKKEQPMIQPSNIDER